jgi:hypothetical protein
MGKEQSSEVKLVIYLVFSYLRLSFISICLEGFFLIKYWFNVHKWLLMETCFCATGDIWQCLKTFLIVTSLGEQVLLASSG